MFHIQFVRRPTTRRATRGRPTLVMLLAIAAAGCSGSTAPAAPPPPPPEVDVFRMSFVKSGETTKVHFAGPPEACVVGVGECVRLPSGFPPIAGITTQVSTRTEPSHYGVAGTIDFADMIFNGAVTAATTYAPASCPGTTGACVAIDVELGYGNGGATELAFITAIGTSVTLKLNTVAAKHLNATFTGQFQRYRMGFGLDTVTILDGYVDAWTSH